MSILSYTKEIIVRDLLAMKEEIQSTDPDVLWVAEPGIINSVGTLCYHICGNLQHFIGAHLGHNGYIRDREAEFNRKNLTNHELLMTIDETVQAVEDGFTKIKEEDLEKEMPDPPPQHNGRSIGFFLIQLCCHLSRHRGQLNYLKRICETKKNKGL
jgi:uncharacterized damage-inducible protein DinB